MPLDGDKYLSVQRPAIDRCLPCEALVQLARQPETDLLHDPTIASRWRQSGSWHPSDAANVQTVGLYCPGATVVPGGVSGGSMVGGPPRAVIHTYEAGYSLDAIPAARRLNNVRNSTHLVFNPVTGAKAACLPANVAARALEHPAGTRHTNRYGAVCLQVEVIAYARRPWTQDLTDAGRESWAQVLEWFDSWGIRRVWPGGAPPGQSGPFPRSLSAWLSQSGYFGHSQVPTQPSGHWDPGALDVDIFFGDGMPTAEEIAAAVWSHPVHGVGSDARKQEAWRWLSSAVHAIEGAPGPIARAVRDQTHVQELAKELVAQLPAGGLSEAQIVAAVETGIRNVLHGA